MKHLKYLVLAACATLIVASSAAAHPDRSLGGEDFPGEGVVTDDQHGVADGHLPAVNRNVRLVGKAEVSPFGAGNNGRVADVAAFGKHAYLTAFRAPTCVNGGAYTLDISNPKQPFEVPSAFMPTTPQNYAGEGAQTLRIRNSSFNGVIFLHQNETCPGAPAPSAPRTRGGINIWDISNPVAPVQLVAHAGDYTNPNGTADTQANSTHSMFAWNNEFDGRTYVVLVDNEELTDVDIMDITDPRNPVMVNDTLDLALPPFSVGQATPSNLTSIFLHDMVVKRIGNRYVMNANYWDGGYVLLDVTNPRPGAVSLIAESDYALLDEERLARGHEISPEGNGHQSELSPDNRFLIGTDEDFSPYRIVAKITSGPYNGTEYTATSASGTPPINATTSISGTPTFVGFACSPLPPGSGVALIERAGPAGCGFQLKLDTIKAAGYSSGIVFNNVRADCLARVTMLAVGTIPFVHVNRLTGLQLLQVPGVTAANACTTATPASGTLSASTLIQAVFDGWGYVRLFKTDIPKEVGASGSISQIDTYAIPESQDPAYATGFGALSVHEVAVDPEDKDIAYLSYYSGGFRVVEYGKKGIEEVGAFIDQGGNNFWGVEVHRVRGEQYVLASDRDFGLYIFQFDEDDDDSDDDD